MCTPVRSSRTPMKRPRFESYSASKISMPAEPMRPKTCSTPSASSASTTALPPLISAMTAPRSVGTCAAHLHQRALLLDVGADEPVEVVEVQVPWHYALERQLLADGGQRRDLLHFLREPAQDRLRCPRGREERVPDLV